MTHDAARSDKIETPIDWEVLARYLAGESPAPERERVERYLSSRPGDAEVLSALDDAMRVLASKEAHAVDVEAALQRVTARREGPEEPAVPISSPHLLPRGVQRTRGGSWRITSILATAAVLVFAARAVLQHSVRPGSELAAAAGKTFATAVGKTESVRLPDGGRVVLGPASRLTIVAGYGARAREVELHGEAYFDVVHDTTRPFAVRVATATVRDVGTTFGVREDGSRVRVVVTSGSVLLRADSAGPHEDVLHAGDVGVVEADGRVSATRDVPTESYLSWMRGTLDYHDAPLSEVSSDLRRWYGIVLRVDDSTLARRHLRATFNGDPIDRVLRVISLDLGADVELHGDTAVLRPRRPQ